MEIRRKAIMTAYIDGSATFDCIHYLLEFMPTFAMELIPMYANSMYRTRTFAYIMHVKT